MKRPTDPSEIRKGDHIRLEWIRSQCGSPRALEYVALNDRMGMRKKLNGAEWAVAQHFLTSRPTPPESLSSKPSLGWFTNSADETRIGFMAAAESGPNADEFAAEGRRINTWFNITTFTPATAVPTEALSALRQSSDAEQEGVASQAMVAHAAFDFLAAVDEAKGAIA